MAAVRAIAAALLSERERLARLAPRPGRRITAGAPFVMGERGRPDGPATE